MQINRNTYSIELNKNLDSLFSIIWINKELLEIIKFFNIELFFRIGNLNYSKEHYLLRFKQGKKKYINIL